MEWFFGIIALIILFGLLAGGLSIPTFSRRDDHINWSGRDRDWENNFDDYWNNS